MTREGRPMELKESKQKNHAIGVGIVNMYIIIHFSASSQSYIRNLLVQWKILTTERYF